MLRCVGSFQAGMGWYFEAVGLWSKGLASPAFPTFGCPYASSVRTDISDRLPTPPQRVQQWRALSISAETMEAEECHCMWKGIFIRALPGHISPA
jgi:hypothetical protein